MRLTQEMEQISRALMQSDVTDCIEIDCRIIKELIGEIDFLREEIQALTHEGRQGEIEQANVKLASVNAVLYETFNAYGVITEKAIIRLKNMIIE